MRMIFFQCGRECILRCKYDGCTFIGRVNCNKIWLQSSFCALWTKNWSIMLYKQLNITPCTDFAQQCFVHCIFDNYRRVSFPVANLCLINHHLHHPSVCRAQPPAIRRTWSLSLLIPLFLKGNDVLLAATRIHSLNSKQYWLILIYWMHQCDGFN